MNVIEKYYDEQYDEWNRLERHFVEFTLTKRYMDTYLNQYCEASVKQTLKIFDIGGGPGRYSLYLGGKGHKVTLLDLSAKNVEVAKQKAAEARITLEKIIKGNALNLEGMDQDYDVILLMGPLYHLLEEVDRRKAVTEALRHLKTGGLLFVSFISAFAPLQDSFSYPDQMGISGGDNDYHQLVAYLKDGRNIEDENNYNGFTTAYFTGIQEAKDLMNSFGLKELTFAGVEGMLACKEHEIGQLPQEEKDAWLEVVYRLSTNEYLLGTSMHFLYIGKKV
ncbi:MAG TPA: class I SAM-dependent methyltransferase [Lachnospiraceae bacterium]|nr:class I SAM-dependent methyltransferase [Lachnospiraceae bacterium]